MAEGYQLKELKVEVTRECPLRCLHCSSNGAPDAPEKLDPDRVSQLIREFSSLGGKTLAISGGEPLVYKELPHILDTCSSVGLKPALYTTGIAAHAPDMRPIDVSTLELLKKCGGKIIFSVHGAKAETHDTLTQVTGSFDITMESIKLALAAGMCAEAHIVPTAINFEEISEMIEMLHTMGVKKVSWLRFVPQGRGRSYKHQLQLSRDQIKQLNVIKKQAQQMFPDMRVRTGSPFNILCPQSPAECVAATSEMAIRPDGNAVPCDAFKQFVGDYRYSNILEYSLTEVWEKSDLLNEVRRLKELRHNSTCKSCPAYSRCHSGCIAQKSIAAGKITNGRDPDCLLEHAEAESGEIEAVTVR